MQARARPWHSGTLWCWVSRLSCFPPPTTCPVRPQARTPCHNIFEIAASTREAVAACTLAYWEFIEGAGCKHLDTCSLPLPCSLAARRAHGARPPGAGAAAAAVRRPCFACCACCTRRSRAVPCRLGGHRALQPCASRRRVVFYCKSRLLIRCGFLRPLRSTSVTKTLAEFRRTHEEAGLSEVRRCARCARLATRTSSCCLFVESRRAGELPSRLSAPAGSACLLAIGNQAESSARVAPVPTHTNTPHHPRRADAGAAHPRAMGSHPGCCLACQLLCVAEKQYHCSHMRHISATSARRYARPAGRQATPSAEDALHRGLNSFCSKFYCSARNIPFQPPVFSSVPSQYTTLLPVPAQL